MIGEKAAAVDLRINFTFTDFDDEWTMWVRYGVLNSREGHADGADLTVAGPKKALVGVILKSGQAKQIVEQAGLPTEGDLGATPWHR